MKKLIILTIACLLAASPAFAKGKSTKTHTPKTPKPDTTQACPQ